MIDPSQIDCVLYHGNCTDGFGAAYAAWRCLGDNVDYHAVHHGAPPPIVVGKTVAILDFAYDLPTMRTMSATCKDVMVIDHHKTNQQDLKEFPNAIFDMNRSGAGMAWDFFHPSAPRPLLIDYIEDRDLWNWKLPKSKEFSAGLTLVPHDFNEYQKLEDKIYFDEIMRKGALILEHSETCIKQVCKSATFRKFKGFQISVVNTSRWMSEVGNRLAEKCDFAFVWYYDYKRKHVKVSLRSCGMNADVSTIAQAFGGGGHYNAAGFTLPTLSTLEEIFDNE